MRKASIETRIVAVGDDSSGVLFPDELVARLGLRAGQYLEVLESPGGITLRPLGPGTSLSEELAPPPPHPGAASGDTRSDG